MYIKESTLTVTDFTPIEVTVVIETKDEMEALKYGGNALTYCEIDDAYSEEHRAVWVELLEKVGDQLT
tara:strand:+ start:686 stop:889 length:204 start_codon:yes stop_codon:yes gene_type:complete